MDDFLAGGAFHFLRAGVEEAEALLQEAPAFAQIGRRLGL